MLQVSFRKRLVSTNESSETNFRLFYVATKTGNEDEEKDVGEGRHCSFDSLLCFCYELFGLVVHSIVPISVA